MTRKADEFTFAVVGCPSFDELMHAFQHTYDAEHPLDGPHVTFEVRRRLQSRDTVILQPVQRIRAHIRGLRHADTSGHSLYIECTVTSDGRVFQTANRMIVDTDSGQGSFCTSWDLDRVYPLTAQERVADTIVQPIPAIS